MKYINVRSTTLGHRYKKMYWILKNYKPMKLDEFYKKTEEIRNGNTQENH